jgi:PAS domain S-box-containing protein
VSSEDLKATVSALEERLAASERAASTLADSERLYRSLFEGTATAVTVRAVEDQRFIDCNQAALRLYGARSVEELRGKRVVDISAESQLDGRPSREAFRIHVDRALATGFERCEWLARRLDGTEFIADIRIAVLELEGGRRVMQSIVDDITERKALDAAVRRRAVRDELVGKISRRFLEGDAEDATRFATESLAAFFRESPDPTERWFRSAATRSPREMEAEAGLVRLVGEMITMARGRAGAEQALRTSEERYRTVVERSHDAIFVFDWDANVVYASPAAERMVGYGANDLVGTNASRIVAAEDQQRLSEGVAAGRVGLPQSPEEWTVVRKDGTRLRVEAVRSPMHDNTGEVVGGLVIARDVTERHRADEMRRETERELARAKEDAIAASAAKSVFVANMSHELRTPLNGVIGMVDLLSRTPLDGRQKRYVEVARASASLLLSVINDILDFSKIEAGKLELERIEFSLRDLVEEVATMLELSAEEKGLELCCETDPALESPAVGDPARVRQVLVNLVNNAIKFTSQGEVTVRAQLRGEVEGTQYVGVEVRDTGVGIASDAQKKLFQPFSQVDASTTRAHGGSGLGLAICHELVRRMGGEIGVDSTPGVGSTFWFTLRLDPPSAEPRPTSIDARLVGLRVLAVDDNATNREILRAQLTAVGMLCDVAESGAEALRLLDAAAESGAPFALAILDQHMPEMDGRELAGRIKADPRIAGTRLVMLGSIGRPLDPVDLYAAGIGAWATKPVWRIQLLRALGVALDDSPHSARAFPTNPLAEPVRPEGRGRVLVVEDAPINAEVVVEILRTAGYSIDLAVDGLEALQHATRTHYDVVLMDCQLPEIDGYEATRRIRALEATGVLPGGPSRRIPILALTASATREDLERARLAGMDDRISKPVDARRLLSAIATHLAHGGQSAGRSSQEGTSSESDAGHRKGQENGMKTGAERQSDDVPKVVDLDRALARLQGNRDLLGRMVAQFRDEAQSARVGLREGIERRDRDPLGFSVHRLRGQALSLDATILASLLGTLEGLVAREQWTECTTTFRDVETALDQLLDVLGRR